MIKITKMEASVIPCEKGYSDHPTDRHGDDSALFAGAKSFIILKKKMSIFFV
jgi:hypothetical protein